MEFMLLDSLKNNIHLWFRHWMKQFIKSLPDREIMSFRTIILMIPK